jgi:hypothetical protein
MQEQNVLRHLTEIERKQVVGREDEVLSRVTGAKARRFYGRGKWEEKQFSSVTRMWQYRSMVRSQGGRCVPYLVGILANGGEGVANLGVDVIERLLKAGLVE